RICWGVKPARSCMERMTVAIRLSLPWHISFSGESSLVYHAVPWSAILLVLRLGWPGLPPAFRRVVAGGHSRGFLGRVPTILLLGLTREAPSRLRATHGTRTPGK